MAKPSFKSMWQSFPDHDKYPTLRVLHTFIGGQLKQNIDIPGFDGTKGNTCAVRMSRALNYSSLPISGALAKSLRIETLVGSDGKRYIFRVRDMRKYLASALGVSPSTASKNFNNAFINQTGVVAFDVAGWSNASGHVALWNGKEFREPKHDDYRNLRDDPSTPLKEPETKGMTLWAL